MGKLSREEIKRRNEAMIIRGQTITDPEVLKRSREELPPDDRGVGQMVNALQVVIDQGAQHGKRRDPADAILAIAELLTPDQALAAAERLAAWARLRAAEDERNGSSSATA